MVLYAISHEELRKRRRAERKRAEGAAELKEASEKLLEDDGTEVGSAYINLERLLDIKADPEPEQKSGPGCKRERLMSFHLPHCRSRTGRAFVALGS